jgi:hypothetical protein
MRRSLADAILKAYAEYAVPNLPEGMPPDTSVPLLVEFRLGDLQALKRSIARIDEMLPHTTQA